MKAKISASSLAGGGGGECVIFVYERFDPSHLRSEAWGRGGGGRKGGSKLTLHSSLLRPHPMRESFYF